MCRLQCVLAPRRVLCFRLLGGVGASGFVHECLVLPTCVTTIPASMLNLKLPCGTFTPPAPAGLICDRGLTLGDLIGVLEQFFSRLGLPKLRFKPAYNPYTEPSMEIFSYSEQLKKWMEVRGAWGEAGQQRVERGDGYRAGQQLTVSTSPLRGLSPRVP